MSNQARSRHLFALLAARAHRVTGIGWWVRLIDIIDMDIDTNVFKGCNYFLQRRWVNRWEPVNSLENWEYYLSSYLWTQWSFSCHTLVGVTRGFIRKLKNKTTSIFCEVKVSWPNGPLAQKFVPGRLFFFIHTIRDDINAATNSKYFSVTLRWAGLGGASTIIHPNMGRYRSKVTKC